MLADLLNNVREQAIDEIEQRANIIEGPGLPSIGRTQRLNALLDELLAALRYGHVDAQAPLGAPTVDLALDSEERELMRRYVIEQIGQHQLEASPIEAALVSQWACSTQLRRVHEENQRLRTLLDAVDESTVILTPDKHFIYVNRHAAQVLRRECGIAEDQIVGRTPDEIGVPTALFPARSSDEMLAMARSKHKIETVSWGRTKESEFDALYAPDGTVSGIIIVARDVHARKLEQARLSLLNKLGALTGTLDYDEVAVALAHVPIPELADWCGFHIVQNKKITERFIAPRDPAKIPLRDALLLTLPNWDRHPLWQEFLTSGFQLLAEVSDDVLRTLATTEEQYRLLLQVGIRSLMLVPVVSRGQIAGIVTFIYTNESGRRYGRDDPALAEEFAVHAAQLIETARLMKELKASESRFRVALAGARTVVFEQDRGLHYIYYYNPLTTFSILGKTPDETFPPDQAASVKKMMNRVLETGESVFEEADLTVPGCPRLHYRKALEPVRDRAGKIVGVIGAATDITEQKQTQLQLSEALTFRERMMGILGHDLRNPLSTIIVTAGLLLERNDLAPDARDHVLRNRRAAERMREMIDTLLDFTLARFLGKVPVTPVPADLSQVATSVADEIRVAWPDRAIEVGVRGDPHGEWDPARLSQVISNLVGNAIGYGDPKMPVRVLVDGTTDNVRLEVSNQGPPIPPDLIHVLFEPFRRGVSADRSPGGLGLGLYIVQQIVQTHGGTIAVESSAGKGTTFTVRLPRHPTSPPAQEHAA